MLANAIRDIWPMLTIFLVVIILIRLMYIHNSGEKFVFYKEFLNLIFLIYALLLYRLLTNTELNATSGMNLIPFQEIMRYKIGSSSFNINVIGNILIFIPFGYFVSSYIKASKISHILIVSSVTSLVIEMVQKYIGRSFDIDDVLLNVTGAILGFLLFVGLSAIKKRLPKFLRSDFIYNVICIILCVIAVIYYLKLSGVHVGI